MTPKERTAWFEEARFGLFIHWNVCAALEGRYAGEAVRQTEYGEWLRARNRVPRADWDRAIKLLHVTPEIVESWAQAAQDAGMRYVIFVSKHHDGLAYWPSEIGDYNINRIAGISFDIVGHLKEACERRGLKLGFYYSHWHDWEHPWGWGNFWDYNSSDPKQFEGFDDFFFWSGEGHRDNLTPEQFDRYWREKSMAQVKELIHRYQPALFWFDCWRNLKNTNMTETQVNDMLAMIREEDPSIVVNSRLGIWEIGGDRGVDYETLGDNEFPHQKIGHPWESAVTFALSWGYSRDDQEWRPATYFIRNLVRNISLGGNLAINFGPTADGRAPEEALACMKAMGLCLKTNQEGFYGCGYTPFEEATQDWGLTTYKEHTQQLYLHVFDWPVDGVIRVNGLITEVKSATLSSTGESLAFRQSGTSVHIEGPQSMPVPYDTVIRLDLKGELQVDNETLGEINGGGIALQASRAQLRQVAQQKPVEHSTKLTDQLGDWKADSQASWDFVIHEPGRWEVKVSYACIPESAGQEYVVETDEEQQLTSVTQTTHLNWSEFRPFTLGVLEFSKAGKHRVTIRPKSGVQNELFKLLWVYLEPVSEA